MFSRVTNHTRPDQRVPSSIFFGTARLFFRKFFSPKGPPLIVSLFCDRMDVGKSQRVPPFSFFRHCEIFFRKGNFSPFQFFDVLRQNPFNCDKNDDKFGSVPLSARHSVHFFEYVIFSKIFFS